jgi:hypothetical protein
MKFNILKKDKTDYKTKPTPHDVFSKYYTDYLKYIFAYKQLK